MAAVTVLVLVAYVLPKFEIFFEDFDAELPFATRLLLSTSRFIENTWLFLVLGAVVVALLLFLYLRSAVGKDVARQNTAAPARRSARWCATRSSNGSSAFSARCCAPACRCPTRSRSATEATNNLAYQRALTQARAEVLRGAGLSQPISATGLFPGAAGQMLRVGEESGTLDQQLELAADYYQGELDFRLKRLTALFEPAVIVIMGLIVGFVAIALVSAMYGIFNQVNIK